MKKNDTAKHLRRSYSGSKGTAIALLRPQELESRTGDVGGKLDATTVAIGEHVVHLAPEPTSGGYRYGLVENVRISDINRFARDKAVHFVKWDKLTFRQALNMLRAEASIEGHPCVDSCPGFVYTCVNGRCTHFKLL